MSVLDIRAPKTPTVTEIKFDDSADRIMASDGGLVVRAKSFNGSGMCRTVAVANWEDLDNFIDACLQAKDMWAVATAGVKSA